MKASHVVPILFFAFFTVLLLVDSTCSTEAAPKALDSATITSTSLEVINVDGDVSLSEAQNQAYWNPHSTGLTNASSWNVTFNNETDISLKTVLGETGHVAAGAWWTCSFKTNQRIPLYLSTPRTVVAEFRADVASVRLENGNEWLRFALACAVKRLDGTIVYTEMDFWDSPAALDDPSGNVSSGGNVVYHGGDVVEYKIGQAQIGQWTSYRIDLTRQISSAWSLKPGDSLESVYAVIEVIGGIAATLKVDDLWITLVE